MNAMGDLKKGITRNGVCVWEIKKITLLLLILTVTFHKYYKKT